MSSDHHIRSCTCLALCCDALLFCSAPPTPYIYTLSLHAALPIFGNTGATSQDMESSKVWVRGYAVRDASRIHSSWRAEQSLDELLESEDVVGIADIDTRMLTRRLRESGTMRGGEIGRAHV